MPYPQLKDPEFLRREYEEHGRPRNDIADEVGCKGQSVIDALRRHGIPVRQRGPIPASGPRYNAEDELAREVLADMNHRPEGSEDMYSAEELEQARSIAPDSSSRQEAILAHRLVATLVALQEDQPEDVKRQMVQSLLSAGWIYVQTLEPAEGA